MCLFARFIDLIEMRDMPTLIKAIPISTQGTISNIFVWNKFFSPFVQQIFTFQKETHQQSTSSSVLSGTVDLTTRIQKKYRRMNFR